MKKDNKALNNAPETENLNTQSKKLQTSVDFNIKLHRIGRLWTLAGVLLILAVPVVIGIYYKAMPDWSIFADAGVLTLLIMNFAVGIAEPLIYSPILGTNGEYLAFISGNLSNLKIPCAVKAQEIAGTKIGTEEHELASTIAIAVSTLVTAVVVLVMVVFLSVSRLQEAVAANPFLQKAFGSVVYALFGSLGGKYLVKNPKLAILPGIVLIGLTVILSASAHVNIGSASLIAGIVLCLICALFFYKRDKRKLDKKQELLRLDAIAAGVSYERVIAIEKAQAADAAEAEARLKARK